MLVLTSVVGISLSISLLILVAGSGLMKKTFFDRELMSPFECGFSTLKEARMPFSLRFFILALIFVIFDVEIIVMLPFIMNLISFSQSSSALFYLMFISILTLGLFNEWNQSMLEWIKFC